MQVRVGMFAVEQRPEQEPQCKGSVVVVTSQPLAALLSQSAKPAAQAIPQTPPLHDAVPLVPLHACPQVPQLARSLLVVVSQPSASLFALQSPKPVAQAPLHTPAAQVRVGMFAPEHTLAQVPQ